MFPRTPRACDITVCADSLLRAHPRMLIGPGAARRCIESFNGRILFIPSNYSLKSTSFPSSGRSQFEPTRLNLFWYYLLVVASLTGFSTLAGQTTVLDARVVDERAQDEELQQSLVSANTPSLAVDKIALQYLIANSSPPAASVRLKRRFEYNFKLAGVRVQMLHFVSLLSDGTMARDSGGREILHLVEVYETSLGPIVAHPAAIALAAGFVWGMLAIARALIM